MTRKLTALVLAASLATTSVVTPAHAGDAEDLGKFLGIAATLFVIGKAIEIEQKNDQRPKQQHHAEKPAPKPNWDRHGDDRWKRHEGKQYGKRPSNPPLPSACVRPGNGRDYTLSERCLERNYQSARPLPLSCRTWADGRHGQPVRAYSLRCLEKSGYETDQFARR